MKKRNNAFSDFIGSSGIIGVFYNIIEGHVQLSMIFCSSNGASAHWSFKALGLTQINTQIFPFKYFLRGVGFFKSLGQCKKGLSPPSKRRRYPLHAPSHRNTLLKII